MRFYKHVFFLFYLSFQLILLICHFYLIVLASVTALSMGSEPLTLLGFLWL